VYSAIEHFKAILSTCNVVADRVFLDSVPTGIKDGRHTRAPGIDAKRELNAVRCSEIKQADLSIGC
jgi:hypothetical protein